MGEEELKGLGNLLPYTVLPRGFLNPYTKQKTANDADDEIVGTQVQKLRL